MESFTVQIPLEFIEVRIGRPTWRELLFGIDNQLVAPSAAGELAAERLGEPDPSADTLELALLDDGEPSREIVQRLADSEPAEPADEIRDTWLFLVLAWMFEQREQLSNPLELVERVYADFDYPPQMEGFVRYMPTDDPDLGDRASNEARLTHKWERFLDEEAARFRAQRRQPDQ